MTPRIALALLAAGCVHGAQPVAPTGETPPFEGPGRLLLVLETDAGPTLQLLDAQGRRTLAIDATRDARFLTPNTLLVVAEVPAEEEFGLPNTELRIVDLASGASLLLAAGGRYYDPEPSPDGLTLAVGAEAVDLGDADLEIWSLEERERVAVRHQSLEEPRWRHDGRALVASVLMVDPESDDGPGGSVLGTSFSWPRLHRLRRDLGEPELIRDGAGADTLAPGGSLALWWDERGLFARQRRGLVRCDPLAGGCTLVFDPGEARRVVDARPVGADEAWLLTVEALDAFDRRQPDEIVRIDLRSGRTLGRWRAPEGTSVTEIDWIATDP